MQKVYCVAYGSNLHPVRMTERVPSARALGVVKLPGFRLAFHKRSKDGSGKGMLYQDDGAVAYGVLYEFDEAHKGELDRLEGKGAGYTEERRTEIVNGESYRAYIYMAALGHIDSGLKPHDGYKALVVAGARHHGMPEPYIAAIDSVESIEDPDQERRAKTAALLERIAAHPRSDGIEPGRLLTKPDLS